MADREKLKARFEDLKASMEVGLFGTVGMDEVEAVLELIRETEPRVLTFEEIKDNMGVPVWVEYADNENWNGYGVPTSDHKAYIMIYGANAYCANYAHTHNAAWRAWSAQPTEEQRKAVKWDAEP